MPWLYLTLLNVLGTAIANIFRRIAMKDGKGDTVASSVVNQFVGALVVGIVALIHGFVLPPILHYPVNVALQAILWGIAILALFKAARYLEAAETAIITAGSSVITIISAVILLHESFSFIYVVGTICILLSIVFISGESKKVRFNKGTLYALIYCLFAGLGSTNDAFMLKYSHSDTLSLLALGFTMPGIFLLIVRPNTLKKFQPILRPRHFSKLFLLAFFYALGAIAYFFAIAGGGQVSQIATISQSAIIITVIIGAIFLQERDHLWRKVICTALVTVGVILLS